MYQALSVSEVTSYLREMLEAHPLLGDLWVQGELSEFKRHTSGHCYFNLKDGSSLLRGVMWKSAAARLGSLPRSGDLILAHGKLGFYEPRGDLQIYVDTILPAGVGLLHARFEELKQRLEAEGLFRPERKRELPPLPRRIALVTAPGGAALQDMLTILGRRCPLVEVFVSPCLVQGDRAPDSIVEALYRAYDAGVDLIILARGGGSLEDLWAFNDEAVARAVYASPVPLVTGVGHETDTTIVDYVSDLRAPTPSAAAELAVPELAALYALVDEARLRAATAIGLVIAERRDAVLAAAHSVERHSPVRRLVRDRQQVDELLRRMERAALGSAELRRAALAGLAGRLAALSPLATLARGYAVVRRADGQVVIGPDAVAPGDALLITLRDGHLDAVVKSPKDRRP